MTTTFHDPIIAGENNSPATVNTRFADLDAAIVEVDERVDTIIADGDSLAEVVDSRNGYTVLDDRLGDLEIVTKLLKVDAAFAGLAGANRFTTITLALAACTGGETIQIAPGIYTEDFTIADDGIKMIGSGKPQYDAGTGRLVNGTIVRGNIITGTVKNLSISDLGVDVVGQSGDCIGATNTADALNRSYRNLTLLGNSDGALGHGLYIVGSGTTGDNIDVYDCYHGIAVHGSNTNLTNIGIYYCYGTTIVIKAKNGIDLNRVNISNVVIEGTSTGSNNRCGPIDIQCADSSNVKDVNISNVTAIQCINSVLYCHLGDGTGSIANISLVNVASYSNRNAAVIGDFSITDGDTIIMTNCRSYNRHNGYAFQINAGTATNVCVYSSWADSSGSGAFSGAFTVAESNGNSPVLDAANTFTGNNVWTGAQDFRKSLGMRGSKASVADNSATGLATLTVSSSLDIAFSCIITIMVQQGATLGTYTWMYVNAYSIETLTSLGEAKFSQTSCTLTAAMNTVTRVSTLTVTQVSGAAATVEICVTPLGISDNQALTLTML